MSAGILIGVLVLVFVVILLGGVGVGAFFFMKKDDKKNKKKGKGTKNDPYENEDPEEKVFVASEDSSADENTNAPVVEPRDCSGTAYIKKGACMRDGKVLDGSKGACGDGKEEWILDPTHENFKFPIAGGKACVSDFRPCNVPCPKPCEGDTWIRGPCVRTDANGNETVLDGTTGKCGHGRRKMTLDKNAKDFKPAVGSGACKFVDSGACEVPCPKPEPLKCDYGSVREYQDNTTLGCVVSETNRTKLGCGRTGEKQQFRVSTINTHKCEHLTKWVPCTTDPCPVDCEGTWSDWGPCIGGCDSQPQKTRKYTVTKTAKHGGRACPYEDGKIEYKNCGKIVPCCEIKSDWKLKPNSCTNDGKEGNFYKDHTGACKESLVKKKDTCWTENTSDWTYRYGGSMIVLDKHPVKCGTDGLNKFLLAHHDWDKIRYEYKCLKNTGGGKRIAKTTNFTSESADNFWNGSHAIDCGGYPITDFRHYRSQQGSEIKFRYNYGCSNREHSGACTNKTTETRPIRSQTDQTLSLWRHFRKNTNAVECGDDEVMSKFKIEKVNNDAPYGKFRYNYTCCKRD